jgi:hypothetical protein
MILGRIPTPMTRSQQIQETVCGVVLAAATGLLGLVAAWLLAGIGICGLDLTETMVVFSLISAAIMPAATVRFLPAPWWVSSLIFCFLFPIILIGGISDKEWPRVLAALGCIAASFGSAWVCRPRRKRF